MYFWQSLKLTNTSTWRNEWRTWFQLHYFGLSLINECLRQVGWFVSGIWALLVLKFIQGSCERSDIETTRWHRWRLCCFQHLLMRLSSSALRGHSAGSPIKMITVPAAYITVTPRAFWMKEARDCFLLQYVQSDRLSNPNTESDSVSVQSAHSSLNQSRLDSAKVDFSKMRWE